MPPKKKSQPKTKKKTAAGKATAGPERKVPAKKKNPGLGIERTEEAEDAEQELSAVDAPIGPAPNGKMFLRCTEEIKELARTLKGQYHELFSKESWSLADTQGELVEITYQDKNLAKEASVQLTRFGNFLSAQFPHSVNGYGSARKEHYDRLIKASAELDNSQSGQGPGEKKGQGAESPMVVLIGGCEKVFSFAGVYVPAELSPFIDDITNLVSDIYTADAKFAKLLFTFARTFAEIEHQGFGVVHEGDDAVRDKIQIAHVNLVKLGTLLATNLPKPRPTEVKIIKGKDGKYSAFVDGVEKKGAHIRTLITLALLREQETFTVEQFMNLYAGTLGDFAIQRCRRCIDLAGVGKRIYLHKGGGCRMSAITFAGDLNNEAALRKFLEVARLPKGER